MIMKYLVSRGLEIEKHGVLELLGSCRYAGMALRHFKFQEMIRSQSIPQPRVLLNYDWILALTMRTRDGTGIDGVF